MVAPSLGIIMTGIKNA